METMLKKPKIFRDSMGRFDRHGKTLSKTAKKTGLIKKSDGNQFREPDGRFKNGGRRPGAGRPKGSPNKLSQSLKEMILASLDDVGGRKYLARLAIENSSAYSSLIGKVLPPTLPAPESTHRSPTLLAASESSGGAGVELRFVREIVYPSGQRHIEGVTPKQLPAPDASHALPRPTDPTDDTNEGAV